MFRNRSCCPPKPGDAQGFVDAHVHVVPAGLSLGRVDLRGVTSRDRLQERVAEAEARLGPREWLLGGQWDEGDWGGQLPTAEWLDQVRRVGLYGSSRAVSCGGERGTL
jgi:predicted amidohydrolase YtcJ